MQSPVLQRMQKPDRKRLQLSAAIGSRTFKRAESVRHEEGCHRKKRGSHSVPFRASWSGLTTSGTMVRTALPAAIPASLTSVLSGTVLCWIRIKGALELEWDESASYPTRPIVGRKQAGRKQAGRRRRPGGGTVARWAARPTASRDGLLGLLGASAAADPSPSEVPRYTQRNQTNSPRLNSGFNTELS